MWRHFANANRAPDFLAKYIALSALSTSACAVLPSVVALCIAGRAKVRYVADNWGGNRALVRSMLRWGDARLVFFPAPATITMSLLSSTTVRHYVGGLVCTVAGAWLTEVTGSLLPLSLGGAVLVMATFPVVRAIQAQRAKRRDTR